MLPLMASHGAGLDQVLLSVKESVTERVAVAEVQSRLAHDPLNSQVITNACASLSRCRQQSRIPLPS